MNFKYLVAFLFILFITMNVVSAEDNITNVEIKSHDLVKYYHNDSQFEFDVFEDNVGANNSKVNLQINGVNYTRTTDNVGHGKFNIRLNPGNYSIITSFKNISVKNNIAVLSILKGNDLVKYYRNSSQYYCTVFDGDGSVLSNVSVVFNINGVFYNRITKENGVARLNINLNPGYYILTATFDGLSMSNNITVLSVLDAKDLVKYQRNSSQYLVTVLDGQGNKLNNAEVTINIHGIFYTRKTNMWGIAKLNINLDPGEYIATAYFNNLAISNNIKVLNRFFSENINSTYGTPSKFNIMVLDGDGSPAINKNVSFNINGRIYNNITDNDGHTSILLNYDSGKYIITYTIDGISHSNSYTVKNSYDMTYYSWDSGANVLKNTLIKNNIHYSDLINQIINLANFGTPMITFKGGEGKKVFITSGVHGNELASQVAAMRLIKYLEDNPISGAVYIIPFVNPKATADNIRNYNGINLNSVANIGGSISNNIVKLICNYNCDSYGDFHCTMPGGVPGNNVAMGSYEPTPESAKISKYISQKTGFSSLIYSYAGSEYSGALEDVVNLKGIPAVTCEVLTPHGVIASGSIERSYAMMMALLEYNNCI